jgi:hypothetical protein
MKFSKRVLYKTTNLIAIAAMTQISESEVMRVHAEFVRDLEGKRFSHKKFIDALFGQLAAH